MQFRDLYRQYKSIKSSIDNSIENVINHSNFISGEPVKTLEQTLADYVGVKHCITCGNGTDAITIGLMAMGLAPTDAVFVPDFTFFSSGECPAALGLPTYFVDVKKETYNIDSQALIDAIESVKSEGKYSPKVVIAVDLFGQPAEYNKLRAICDQYDMFLFEDAAQGFGGKIGDSFACSFGDISTTSFFPAKPLGCYGDGGAIFTDNDEWAALIRSICVHGKNKDDKYDNIRLGMNSRLDTIQAAVLNAKFPIFKNIELDNVNRVASWYNELLADAPLTLPTILDHFTSSWAQYTVQLPEGADRDKIQIAMKNAGIPTMVYYKKPMHRQGAFQGTVSENASCPNTDKLCRSVLCLPIHPYMERNEVEMVAEKLREVLSLK